MSLNFEIGKTYTFNTLAPGILQATVKNAKLISVLDYTTAMDLQNVDLMFRQIYPALPPGTPNTPQTCKYYRFVAENGDKTIFADVWIDPTSITSIEGVNWQVNLFSASIEDGTRLRDMMNAMSYTDYTITQV